MKNAKIGWNHRSKIWRKSHDQVWWRWLPRNVAQVCPPPYDAVARPACTSGPSALRLGRRASRTRREYVQLPRAGCPRPAVGSARSSRRKGAASGSSPSTSSAPRVRIPRGAGKGWSLVSRGESRPVTEARTARAAPRAHAADGASRSPRRAPRGTGSSPGATPQPGSRPRERVGRRPRARARRGSRRSRRTVQVLPRAVSRTILGRTRQVGTSGL